MEGRYARRRDGYGKDVSLSKVRGTSSLTLGRIQTIALLLSEPRRKPSLVVAPVVALMQWKHEIETHAEGFTTCLWHGQGRMKAAELKKFDVVSQEHLTCSCVVLMVPGAGVLRNARGEFPAPAARV